MFPVILLGAFILGVVQVNGDAITGQDSNGNTGSESVDLRGQFSWELLFDFDNTDNDVPITQEGTYTTSLDVSLQKLETEVSDAISGGANGAIEILGVKRKSVSNLEALKKLEEILREGDAEFHEEHQVTETFTVGPRSSLKLYQLVFNGFGIFQKLDKIYSDPYYLDDVIISCAYRLKSSE